MKDKIINALLIGLILGLAILPFKVYKDTVRLNEIAKEVGESNERLKERTGQISDDLERLDDKINKVKLIEISDKMIWVYENKELFGGKDED